MKLFDPFVPARDTVYIALRDYGHLVDARNHVEELWQYFEPYADPHFSNKIAVEFHARYWEMYLGYLALRVGLPLMPSNGKGPDLRITLPIGTNLFIEATAPGPGTDQNRVPEPKLTKAGDFNAIFEDVPIEQVVLRITSGVESKFKAYKRYLQDKTLRPDDPYVVAVNPGGMTFARGEYDPPLIIQSLFAVGNLMVLFDRDDPALDETRYSIRHQIIKHNDEPIRTNYFLDSEYRGLSAVIFSDAYPLSLPKPDGREFKLVHNPHAENPIDRGLFKIGREYWVERTRIHSTNWNEYSSSC